MTRIRIIFTILFLLATIRVWSIETELKNTFNSANAEYQNGNYLEASELYKSIIGQDYTNAEVYFNLGNCFYKLQQYPSAILFYEKARKLSPEDADINYNLKLANLKITDKIEPLPQFILSKIWKSVLFSQNADSWGVSAIIFLAISCGLVVLFLVSSTTGLKKLGFYSCIIAFTFSFFSFIFGLQQKAFLMNESEAIVFEASLTVKSAPNESGTKLFVIHEGAKVKILEKLDDWSKVSLANGNEGWVKSSTLQTI